MGVQGQVLRGTVWPKGGLLRVLPGRQTNGTSAHRHQVTVLNRQPYALGQALQLLVKGLTTLAQEQSRPPAAALRGGMR